MLRQSGEQGALSRWICLSVCTQTHLNWQFFEVLWTLTRSTFCSTLKYSRVLMSQLTSEVSALKDLQLAWFCMWQLCCQCLFSTRYCTCHNCNWICRSTIVLQKQWASLHWQAASILPASTALRLPSFKFGFKFKFMSRPPCKVHLLQYILTVTLAVTNNQAQVGTTACMKEGHDQNDMNSIRFFDERKSQTAESRSSSSICFSHFYVFFSFQCVRQGNIGQYYYWSSQRDYHR